MIAHSRSTPEHLLVTSLFFMREYLFQARQVMLDSDALFPMHTMRVLNGMEFRYACTVVGNVEPVIASKPLRCLVFVLTEGHCPVASATFHLDEAHLLVDRVGRARDQVKAPVLTL